MRISPNTLTAGLLVGVGLSLAACNDKLLDVAPRNNGDLATALNTTEGLDATLNGIYDRLQSTALYGRDMLALAEALADNAQATNKSGRLNAENRNAAQATFGNWATSYFAINQANLLLEAVPRVTALTDTNRRNSILGQGYFLRALLYHDLMRTYAYDPGVEIAQQNRGGVPLILTGVSDQSQIAFPPRAPIADVYQQLYSDLQAAIGAFSRTSANNVAYGNRQASQLLFSRVALYNKDYANAVKYATDAIGGTVKTPRSRQPTPRWYDRATGRQPEGLGTLYPRMPSLPCSMPKKAQRVSRSTFGGSYTSLAPLGGGRPILSPQSFWARTAPLT
jgi:hypothetical protein